MKNFLASNEWTMRLARTIFQAIIGVIIAYVDVIVAQMSFIPDEMRPVIVALVMAVLSPIMAMLGGDEEQ